MAASCGRPRAGASLRTGREPSSILLTRAWRCLLVRMVSRTLNHGGRGQLHAMGLREEAAAQFRGTKAERHLQEEHGCRPHPLLYSLAGASRRCTATLPGSIQGRDSRGAERAAQTCDVAPSSAIRSSTSPGSISLTLGRAHILAVQRGAAGDLAQSPLISPRSLPSTAPPFPAAAGYHESLPPPRPPRPRSPPHPHPHPRLPLARKDLTETLTSRHLRCGFPPLHEC